MNDSIFTTIISKIVDNAMDSFEEAIAKSDNSFYEGKRLAYYEILEMIQSELDINDLDLSEYGLALDLESFGLKEDGK